MSELLIYLKTQMPDERHRELYCHSLSAFLSGTISAPEFEQYLRLSLDTSLSMVNFSFLTLLLLAADDISYR